MEDTNVLKIARSSVQEIAVPQTRQKYSMYTHVDVTKAFRDAPEYRADLQTNEASIV